jgi:hypothetical protein
LAAIPVPVDCGDKTGGGSLNALGSPHGKKADGDYMKTRRASPYREKTIDYPAVFACHADHGIGVEVPV